MTRKLILTFLAVMTIFLTGMVDEAKAATSQEIKDMIVKILIMM